MGGELIALNLNKSPDGEIIAAGWATSEDTPVTPGVFDETANGGNDTYLLKINRDLSKILAATFIGGSKNER